MSIRKIALPGLALAAGLLGAAVLPPVTAQAGSDRPAVSDDEVYLAAGLRGANEVGVPGDRDGRATAAIRIKGSQVTFALRWNRVAPPTAAHIHLGGRGTNGDVKVDFLAKALPRTVLGITGTVTVNDAALLTALRENPTGFYANLHNGVFPKGAVRGQFHRLNRPIDLNGVLHGSNQATIGSLADGSQEVQADDGRRRGDADGAATWWIRPNGVGLAYTATWTGLDRPTNGHIHRGVKGRNGDVVADLFLDATGLPANLTGVAGEAPVRRDTVKKITENPGRYYTNLHTVEFDGGAVRGQLSDGAVHPRAVTAPVLSGAQIYACTRQPLGGFAFTQHNVSAVLERGVAHSFVQPVAGPPQWIAPDGSSVTGRLVTRIPNGDGNIPELVLDAVQTGRPTGLLSHATQILRLNTVGGVAPTGTCDPARQPIVKVPYRSDYLFLG